VTKNAELVVGVWEWFSFLPTRNRWKFSQWDLGQSPGHKKTFDLAEYLVAKMLLRAAILTILV